MPWCEDCAKFWSPNTMPVDGTCPTCHAPIASSQEGGPAPPRSARADRRAAQDTSASRVVVPDATAGGADEGDTPRAKVPWHFWVMVSAVVAYLGWRLIQGVVWVGQQVFG